MNDDGLTQRKRECNCDVNELLEKERQWMRGFSIDQNSGGYVFCAQHGVWIPFEWTKAAA